MRCIWRACDAKRWCGLSGEPSTRSRVRDVVVVAFSSDWTFAYIKWLLPASVNVACWVDS